MKLAFLHSDVLWEGFRYHADRAEPLLATMPRRKRRHSKRVGKDLDKSGAGDEGVYAGLLHDYLERGGDLETLQQHIDDLGLPPKVVRIILALTADDIEPDEGEANQVLAHLKSELPKLDQDIRNIAVLAKMADRLDNMRGKARRKKTRPKKNRQKKVPSHYRRKSIDIIRYLASHYSGDPEPFNYFVKEIQKLIKPKALAVNLA